MHLSKNLVPFALGPDRAIFRRLFLHIAALAVELMHDDAQGLIVLCIVEIWRASPNNEQLHGSDLS